MAASFFDKTWLYPGSSDGLYYTSDGGASWEKEATSAYYPGFSRGSDGKYYIGSDNGILQSVDARIWTLIPNSPKAVTLVEAGANWYASFTNDYSGHPFHSAASSNPAAWTLVATPSIPQGAFYFVYDSSHRILYAACFTAGLWRLVMQ